MFGGEGVKVIPENAVLTSRKPERSQIAFLDPP
jgi:hypothetical protein